MEFIMNLYASVKAVVAKIEAFFAVAAKKAVACFETARSYAVSVCGEGPVQTISKIVRIVACFLGLSFAVTTLVLVAAWVVMSAAKWLITLYLVTAMAEHVMEIVHEGDAQVAVA